MRKFIQSFALTVCGVAAAGLSISSPVRADEVLVLGGTGQLGARLVRLLAKDNHQVSVFVRPTSDRSRLEGLDIDYVVGDLLNADEVRSAFSNAQPRIVIVAVRAPISEVSFYDIASRNIVAAAQATGVEQIIHHGAVGAGENMAQHPDVPWDSVPGLNNRMKDHGKAEENLLKSGIPSTIIRNSRVWPDNTPGTGQAYLSEDQSVLMPITRADLAVLTLQCVNNGACAGKIYHAADPSLVGKTRPGE